MHEGVSPLCIAEIFICQYLLYKVGTFCPCGQESAGHKKRTMKNTIISSQPHMNFP